MQLKRHYAIPEGWEAQHNIRDAHGNLPEPDKEEGVLLNPLPVEKLSVIHTGVAQEQNFSRRLIDAGVAEGWATLSRGMIIIHTAEEDLRYTILCMPGRHCMYCRQHYPTDPSGSESRKHVAAAHPDMVPDPQWPHGYKVVEGYECVLDAEQHARHQVPAYATVSHARWKETEKEKDKPAETRTEQDNAVADPEILVDLKVL